MEHRTGFGELEPERRKRAAEAAVDPREAADHRTETDEESGSRTLELEVQLEREQWEEHRTEAEEPGLAHEHRKLAVEVGSEQRKVEHRTEFAEAEHRTETEAERELDPERRTAESEAR
jgi:hypothetical protein